METLDLLEADRRTSRKNWDPEQRHEVRDRIPRCGAGERCDRGDPPHCHAPVDDDGDLRRADARHRAARASTNCCRPRSSWCTDRAVPVCVTPLELIDKALAIASQPDVIFCSYGDMLRVPGSGRDLFSVRGAGRRCARGLFPARCGDAGAAKPAKAGCLLCDRL
ncbi:MAG: hypothetical protein MZV64_60110 [Ignavibacteriales bacterium]|nr:hypothetical protein [Ignavibacteriales bacterium]